MRWGFEHLQLDPARVKALGAEGLFHSIDVTCSNHEGDGYVTFQQWDGKKWVRISDWIAPDWALLRPIIEASANKYAAEHKITRRAIASKKPWRRTEAPHERHIPVADARGYRGRLWRTAILAVRGVSLSVGQGEIVALLGANGAGKSSTLRAVSNLLPAKRGRLTRGRITFDGRVTTGVPTSRLVSTGLVQVLEGRHCFRALTVEENLITAPSAGRRPAPRLRATSSGSICCSPGCAPSGASPRA